MFTLNVLELMLFDGRSVLTPAKRLAGSDRVKSEAVWLLVRQPKVFIADIKFRLTCGKSSLCYSFAKFENIMQKIVFSKMLSFSLFSYIMS